MNPMPAERDGNAVVHCEGAFNTAHGLVPFTNRYRVLAVIDSRWAGPDAGEVLDALVNDFVSGEIEHVVLRARDESRPDVIVIEGQAAS